MTNSMKPNTMPSVLTYDDVRTVPGAGALHKRSAPRRFMEATRAFSA
jgi:hypothetical protein